MWPVSAHFNSAWMKAVFSLALSPEWMTDRLVFRSASLMAEISAFGAYCWISVVSTMAEAETAVRARAVAAISVFIVLVLFFGFICALWRGL